MTSGYLNVALGSMFAGKTDHLLRSLGRWLDVNPGCKVIYINHVWDTRSTEDMSTHASHTQLPTKLTTRKCQNLGEVDVTQYRVIGVDEAQFFSDLVPTVRHWVEDLHKVVYVVGLDGTFDRKPFGEVLNLLPLADEYHKLYAVCKECIEEHANSFVPAAFTRRFAKSSEVIAIGAGEIYQPVCRKHWRAQ